MGCLICRDMERAIESRHEEYIEARLAAYYRFCTRVAARRMVEFERAKTELEEHKQVCAATPVESAHLPDQGLFSFP